MEKIILAPKQMHRDLLLKSRKEDFFINPKILTKEELLDKYYGKIQDSGAYYLYIKKSFKYDNLMKMIPYIPRSSSSNKTDKVLELAILKEELNRENLIQKDEFFDQFIKGAEVEVYGYSELDHEIITLLDSYKLKYEFVPFSKGNNKLHIKKFPLIEDEIFYLLNEISKLLEQGVSPNDIYIYTSNENALFYLKKYHDSFGFKINFPNDTSIYSQESVTNFLNTAFETGSFEIAFRDLTDSNNFVSEDILELIADLLFSSVEFPFVKKYDYISSYLKKRKIQNIRYENGISVIDGPIFTEGKHIFIPCFAQNIFPQSFKDNEYISDDDKKELGVLTSLEKCRTEDAICRDFLFSNNNFYLSRSSAAFSERFFPSPFVKSLGIDEVEVKDLPDVIYSKKYAEYRLGIDKDNKLYFLQHSKNMKSLESQLDFNYRNYDNSYTNAEVISENDLLEFSYTKINNFYNCPFAYYLNYILKVSIKNEAFDLKFGKVAHYVFEHQYDDDFDFETCFDHARNLEKWDVEEELFVDKLKEDIKSASDAAILHYKHYMKNPVIKTELDVRTYIDPNTVLDGKIDKAVILDGTDAILIDYKTNKESFKMNQLEYGLSMQLPTYAYLFNSVEEYKDVKVTGLYINNVINNSYTLEKADDEIIDSYLKLNGVTIANLDYVSKIDESIINEKSQLITGLTQKGGKFGRSKSIIGEDDIKNMSDLVLEKYREASRRIRNNQFEISPLFLDRNGACKYCQHKDICFVRANQKREKKKEDEEDN